jgi:DNA-binding response OmpR family regulator
MEERLSLLFVDPQDAGLYLPALRTRFEVTVVSTETQALRAMKAFRPTMVVTELALEDGDGVSICRHAKTFVEPPPAVLAVTSSPERVPDALAVGCDGVLVKPFAPNLLFSRIGRLLRQRAIVAHDEECPACRRGGVVSFDVVSRDRSWYACVACRKVWVGVSAEAGGASRTPGTGLPPRAAASC